MTCILSTVRPAAKERSRLTFLAGVASGGAMAGCGVALLGRPASAAETIKVGFVSPKTGPLAGFGEADAYVVALVRKALAKGFVVGTKSYAVEIIDVDTQSDPARASQLAKQLVTSDGVDMILTTSTPETVNPVSDASEAAGMPCLATIMPWEAWYFGRGAKPGAPSPFKWTYLFSFGTKQFVDSYLAMWPQIPTNKKVGVLYPNDADGNAIRGNLAPQLVKHGYTVIDAGPYEDGTTDFSAQIAKFKSERCEIFNTFPIPPDFATFWRQAAQQGYTKMVKIVQVAKTGIFPSQIEALGSLGDKLVSGAYWHPTFPYHSPVTGLSSRALSEGYERATGHQWIAQLGATQSLFDAGFAALKASGDPKNKAALAHALSRLDTSTTIGNVNFTSGPVPNVSPTAVIGGQWVKAAPGSRFPFEMVLVEHSGDPKVPIGGKLSAYS